jgi:hypothetical protein
MSAASAGVLGACGCAKDEPYRPRIGAELNHIQNASKCRTSRLKGWVAGEVNKRESCDSNIL